MNSISRFFASARLGSVAIPVASLLLLAAAMLPVLAFAACSDDDATTNNYIGVTDASPPRLGTTDGDAGTAQLR